MAGVSKGKKERTGRPGKLGDYVPIAELYDAEYAGLDYLQQDVPFVLRLLGRRHLRVLELGCGTGRATLALARAGHEVTGVDFSAGMLAVARQKAAREPKGVAARLHWIRQDLRRLKVGAKGDGFDAVLLLFNTLCSFSRLADLTLVLARAAAAVRPGGRLVVDLFFPSFELIAQAADGAWGLDPHDFKLADGTPVRRTIDLESTSDPSVQRITHRYLIGSGSKQREVANPFLGTWTTPRELTLLLEQAGLRCARFYSDYAESLNAVPDWSTARRIIVVAVKPKASP